MKIINLKCNNRSKAIRKLIFKKVSFTNCLFKFKYILFLFLILVLGNNAIAQSNSVNISSLGWKCYKGDTISCNELKSIATNDKDANVRIAAIKQIYDQKFLTDIAKNDKDADVRIAAIKKIRDQNVLADIAKNDKSQGVRINAVIKVNDQNVLADIAMNDIDMYVRAAAVHKITNQNVLADVAMNDTKAYVRSDAIKKISDQNILINISNNGKYDGPRLSAINSVNENKYYGQLVEIIDQYIKTNKNLASISALKIIPKDKILNNNYEVLEILVEVDYRHQRYSGAGDLWKRYDFTIEIKTNKFTKSFFYGGKKGPPIASSETDFEKIHFGFIDINQICEVLLSPLSKDDLLKISNESDVYYLRKTAKSMLQK